MNIPADIRIAAQSWKNDHVFSASSRRSSNAPFGAPKSATIGGNPTIMHGALHAVIDGTLALSKNWGMTPLAVVDLGRGYWLVSQTHVGGRLFSPANVRLGNTNFIIDGPSKVAAIVDAFVGGSEVTVIGKYADRA